jgi:hypothetical protein
MNLLLGLFLVLLGLLVVAVLCFQPLLTRAAGRRPRFTFLSQRPIAAPSPTAHPGAPFQFLMPFVLHEGVPLVTIQLDSQSEPFVCVADTGSLHLNVSADTCRKCNKSDGIYEATQELRLAVSTTLTYGTQKDAVKQVRDHVQFHHDSDFIPVPVHVTVRRDVTLSNYNVMGLLQTIGGGWPGRRGDGLLSHILADNHYLYLQYLRGTGFVGSVDEDFAGDMQRDAVVRARQVPSSLGFYMVRITGMYMGTTPIPTKALYLIIDSGSNMMSMDTHTLQRCMPGMRLSKPMTIELDGQPFVIQPRNYRWMNGPEMMVDDDLTVLNNSPKYIIIGSYCMQEYDYLFTPHELVISHNIPLHDA